MLKKSIFISILILLFVSASNATVAQLINYQGWLTDGMGNPLNSNVSIQFKIYDLETGGSVLWTETQTIVVTDGMFSVLLGSITPIPFSVFDGNIRYLALQVASDPEMIPRKSLVSVGYSYRACNSDKLDGIDGSAFIQSIDGVSPNNTGNVDLVQGSNITIAPDAAGNKITISASTGGGGDNFGNHIATQNISLNNHWLSNDGSDEGLKVDNTGGVQILNNLNVGSSIEAQGHILSNNIVKATNSLTLGHVKAIHGIISSTFPGGYSAGVRGENKGTAGNGIGVYGSQNGSGWGVYGVTPAGRGVYGKSETGYGVYGNNNSGNAGYLGGSSYGVHGQNSNGSFGYLGGNSYGVWGENNNGNYGSIGAAFYGVIGFGVADMSHGVFGYSSSNRGVFGKSNTGTGVYGRTNSLESDSDDAAIVAHNTSTGDLYHGLNSAEEIVFAVKNNGTTSTKILEITGGSDLAEPFDITDAGDIKPGMVVTIDPENPGQLRLADKAYDRTVAGCVSGANGINPGLTMHQKGTVADGSQLVALSGRVYCQADAFYGSIQPGDLLTTSDTPGHAMKVIDYNRAQGAILGKAMTSLQQGKGLVLVLVALQ